MEQKMAGWQWMEAGRLAEDYGALDAFADEFKRKVLDLISLCQYRTVVLDFDGTMTEFRYARDRLLPCRDDDINEYFSEHNFYENCKALKTIQFILDILCPFDSEGVYILSVSQPNVRLPKLECIRKHFPMIREENVFQVLTADEKLEVLKGLYEKHGREILFIEDTAKTLLNAEEQLDFVRGYHISSLIP